MQATQLWRYPVKSMIGEPVTSLDLDDVGVIGDRTWATRDLERGGIRGAKKIPRLMQLAASDIGNGHARITLPDGTSVCTSDADVHDRVSAAVAHQVRLERLRPADDVEHYRRGAPDSEDIITELRSIFGRVDDEPIPDLSVFPPELVEFESPPGAHYDAFPLMIMTEQAVADLTQALPESSIDVRRFRPSIVIDAAEQWATTPGHPEFGWVGRSARLGTALLEFTAACPRCVMVTRQVDESTPEDRSLLRYIVRELDQNVGVYATITQPGTIHLGDELTLV